MIRVIMLLMAVAALVYGYRYFKELHREKLIEEMNGDELVSAVIQRRISILDVPSKYREQVNQTLKEIQQELDHP